MESISEARKAKLAKTRIENLESSSSEFDGS